MSSDERDPKEDPAEELKQGLGHLWRAARGVAKVVKKEVDKSDLGKALDDAGRELARAATNVVGRISEEISKSRPAPGEPPPPEDRHEPPPHPHDEDDDFDGVKVKPRDEEAPPAGDAGLRIQIDEPEKKKPE